MRSKKKKQHPDLNLSKMNVHNGALKKKTDIQNEVLIQLVSTKKF